MAGDPDWVPPGVDIKRANVARVWDYWLGGSHNFLADQDLARAIMAVEPNARAGARPAASSAGRCGSSPRPVSGSSSTSAPAYPPRATCTRSPSRPTQRRVAYVDIDPVAVAHSQAILAGNQNAAIIDADLREPERILAATTTRRLIDFGQPVGLLLFAVLHFIADAEDPWRIVATLRDALAPGSHSCWATQPVRAARRGAGRGEGIQQQRPTQIHMRSHAEILRFFDGFELVDPGLVYIPQWRPTRPSACPPTPAS